MIYELQINMCMYVLYTHMWYVDCYFHKLIVSILLNTQKWAFFKLQLKKKQEKDPENSHKI